MKRKIILFIIIFSYLFISKNVYGIEVQDYMLKKYDVIPGVYVTKISNEHKIYDYMYIIARKSDYKHIYCIEPGVHINSNALYNGYIENALFESKLTSEQLEKIKTIAYYGYGYVDKDNNVDHTDKKWYAVTQYLIWEIESNNHEIYFTSYLQGPKVDMFKEEKEEIKALVNKDLQMPFFENIKNISIGETIELIDTNDVLNLYNVTSTENASVKKNGNKLIITAKKIGNVKIKLIKKYDYYDEEPIVYTYSSETQRLFSVGNLDNKELELDFNVNAGKIKIQKIDHEDNQLLNDATLENAVYEVYDDNNNLVKKLITDSSGEAISDYLPYGRYFVKEQIASNGYTLDEKVYEVIIEENKTYEVISKEKIITKNVLIKKYYGLENKKIIKPEAGVLFDIFLKANEKYCKTVETDENGIISLDLPYGEWLFKQTSSKEGYAFTNDFFIKIDNKDINKEIVDNVQESKIKVNKIDSQSKKLILRNNMLFKIKSLKNDSYLCENDECLFNSTNGFFITNNFYPFGKYEIEEVPSNELYGYSLNKEKVSFIIDENNILFDDQMNPYIDINFENKPVKGSLELNKYGERMMLTNNNYYYDKILLDNVSFDLVANGNVYAADGTLEYKDKEIVTSFKTNNGYFKINNLDLGSYCLIETNVNNNYKIKNDNICFSINYDGLDTLDPVILVSVNNYLKKGKFELTKIDSVSKKSLSGVLIEVYNINDELVYKGYTNNEGKIILDNLMIGKYKYKEKGGLEGYLLDENCYYFEIKNDKDIVKSILPNDPVIADAEIIAVPNTLKNSYKGMIFIMLFLVKGFIYVKKKI